MPTEIICPDCDTTLRIRQRIEPGQKIRCTNCDYIFTPDVPNRDTKSRHPRDVKRTRQIRDFEEATHDDYDDVYDDYDDYDDDYDDRPRRRRRRPPPSRSRRPKKKQTRYQQSRGTPSDEPVPGPSRAYERGAGGNRGVGGCIAVLFLGSQVALGAFFVIRGCDGPGSKSKNVVTKDNYNQIGSGMTEDEVYKILGDPDEILDGEDLRARMPSLNRFGRQGRTAQALRWGKVDTKGDEIVVLMINGRSIIVVARIKGKVFQRTGPPLFIKRQ